MEPTPNHSPTKTRKKRKWSDFSNTPKESSKHGTCQQPLYLRRKWLSWHCLSTCHNLTHVRELRRKRKHWCQYIVVEDKPIPGWPRTSHSAIHRSKTCWTLYRMCLVASPHQPKTPTTTTNIRARNPHHLPNSQQYRTVSSLRASKTLSWCQAFTEISFTIEDDDVDLRQLIGDAGEPLLNLQHTHVCCESTGGSLVSITRPASSY